MLLEKLSELKEAVKNTALVSEDVVDELRLLMKETFTYDEEYCTSMWILAKYYEQIDNKNACTYCCLRANEIYEMNTLPVKKRNPLLQYTNFVMEEDLKKFIQSKIGFMKDKNAHISRSLIMVSFLFGSCIFLLSIFLLKMNFLGALLQWFFFSFLTYFLAIRTAKHRYYILQSQASGKYLEECDKAFDEHYY